MIETNRSMNNTWIKGPATSPRPVSRKSISTGSVLPTIKNSTLKSDRGTRTIQSVFNSDANDSDTTSKSERYVLYDLIGTVHIISLKKNLH